MDFGELLRQKKEAIVARWLEDSLKLYPSFASDAFRKQRNQFANPVGHSLRVGTSEIFDALVDSMDDDAITGYLTEIIKIRAVQQFDPSEALRFVFCLKGAVRSEIGDVDGNPDLAAALLAFDARIDRVVLQAFDIFVACRERVYQLRVDEARRRVSWVVERLNGRDATEPAGPPESGPELVTSPGGPWEDSR